MPRVVAIKVEDTAAGQVWTTYVSGGKRRRPILRQVVTSANREEYAERVEALDKGLREAVTHADTSASFKDF